MRRPWRLGAIILLLTCPTLAGGADALPLTVVAGTSLVADIVRDVTGGGASMVILTPGASCPGHADLKATDVAFAAAAEVALLHPFQADIPQVRSVLAAANPTLRVEWLAVPGSWTIPAVQAAATRRIGHILAAVRPGWTGDLRQRIDARLARLAAARAAAARRLAPLAGKPVLASAMQAEFLRWAGLRVVQEYGRMEDLTARELVALTVTGRGQQVVGVVDNLQSGADAGRPVAEELRVPHVVLSNFPGSLPGADDYFGLLEVNVHQIVRLATP